MKSKPSRTVSRRRPDFGKVFAVVLAGWLCAVILIPIVWIILTSIKPESALSQFGPVFVFEPTFEHYAALFAEGLGSRVVLGTINSLFIAVTVTVLAVALATLAAYSLARLRPRGHKAIMLGIFALRMLPPVALIVPLYVGARSLDLIDTHIALIVPYTALAIPLGTWMLYGFFLDLPRELEEAAMVDGATPLQAFVRVVLPLAGPGVAAVSVFSFAAAWNDLVLALPLTRSDAITLPVVASLVRTDQGIAWGQLGALTVMIMLPMIAFTLLAQRWLVRGFAGGGVKG